MNETHHINLNPTDDSPGNLISLEYGDHRFIHEQLGFLMDNWKFGLSRNDLLYRPLIQHFLRTGEMVFDRDELWYEMCPKEGSPLSEFEKSLNAIGIYPPHTTRSREETISRIYGIWGARKEFYRTVEIKR